MLVGNIDNWEDTWPIYRTPLEQQYMSQQGIDSTDRGWTKAEAKVD